MGSSLFGYAVTSELPLERLTDAPAPRGRLSVVSASRPLLDDEGELVAWMEADQPARWLALARSPAGLLGACSETGAFLVEPEYRRVHAEPRDGTGEAWQGLEVVAAEADAVLAGLGVERPAGDPNLILAPDAATLARDLAANRKRLAVLRADAVGPSVRALDWGNHRLFGVDAVKTVAAWGLTARLPQPVDTAVFDRPRRGRWSPAATSCSTAASPRP